MDKYKSMDKYKVYHGCESGFGIRAVANGKYLIKKYIFIIITT